MIAIYASNICLYASNQLIQQILVQMIYLIKLQCICLFCNAMSSFIRLFCNAKSSFIQNYFAM